MAVFLSSLDGEKALAEHGCSKRLPAAGRQDADPIFRR
jgi:hypothetical protein